MANNESFWAQYARYGWSFIPVQGKSKKPLLPAWKQYQDRKPTPEEVKQWETQYPHVNVAVICGAVSGLVVLDIDSDDGFKWLKQNGCHVPPTPRVSSSPGKLHIYFKHPGFPVKNMIRKVPGIDIKGDGGYVVAPPSVHPSGARYKWLPGKSPEDTPVAECPPWLLDLIDTGKTPQAKDAPVRGKSDGKGTVALDDTREDDDEDYYATTLRNGVSAGLRNNACTRLAGFFIAKGMAKQQVLSMLIAWNYLNDPPMDHSEIETTVDSIVRSEVAKKIREAPHLYNQATKTADDNGNPQEPELSQEEARQAALCGLADSFGLPLRNISKITGDSPQYVFLIGDQEVSMNSGHLVSQMKFRTRIMEATNALIPKMKQAEWDQVIQAILNAADTVVAGEDATIVGELKWHIVDYLSQPHLHNFDTDPEPTKESNDPFIWRGEVFLNKEAFLKWLTSYRLVAKPDGKAVSQNFSRLGMVNKKKWIGPVAKQVRVWRVPDNIYSLVLDQLKEGGGAQHDRTINETT